MKRLLWCVTCLGVLLFACLGTRQEVPSTRPSESTVTTRIQPPEIQRVIDLRTFRWGQRLYPTDTVSAYTVVITSPVFHDQFAAYGFDVQRGAAPFAVFGPMSSLETFKEQVRRETASIPGAQEAILALVFATNGGASLDGGMVPPPPSPAPSPGSSSTDGGDDGSTMNEGPIIVTGPGTGDPNVNWPPLKKYTYGIALSAHVPGLKSVNATFQPSNGAVGVTP